MPEARRILLVDFKAEDVFAGLERLPHVAGAVSDLERSAEKLDRFQEVLLGELAVRDELLAATKEEKR